MEDGQADLSHSTLLVLSAKTFVIAKEKQDSFALINLLEVHSFYGHSFYTPGAFFRLFSYFSTKTYVVGTQKTCPKEAFF